MLAVTPIQQAIQPLLDLEHRYFDAQTEERHQLREQILEAEANVFRVAVGDRQQYWLGKQRDREDKIKLMKGKASRDMEKERKEIADKLAELAKFAAEVESGERSLEELYRLKRADTEAEKAAILEELEQAADLVSLDEMRLPLLEFIQQKTQEAVEEIPLGIHSTRTFKIPDPTFAEGGLFLAFKAGDRHFWQFYPSLRGHISTEPSLMVTDKRKIFNWIKCKESDFPPPEDLPPVEFDTAIFRILPTVIDNLLEYFKKQQTSSKLKPQLTKLLQKIHHALTELTLFDNQPIDEEAKARILKVISTVNLRIYERDIKGTWDSYTQHQDLNTLVAELDEYFVENDLYHEIEEEKEESPLKVIKQEDIQLVCYEWFKSE